MECAGDVGASDPELSRARRVLSGQPAGELTAAQLRLRGTERGILQHLDPLEELLAHGERMHERHDPALETEPRAELLVPRVDGAWRVAAFTRVVRAGRSQIVLPPRALARRGTYRIRLVARDAARNASAPRTLTVRRR